MRARVVLTLPSSVPTRTKGLLLLLIAAVVLALSSTALATPGDTVWTKRYDGPASSTDQATAIAVSPDGTKVYATGASDSSTTYSDYSTLAYDASTGAKIWTRRYNGPGDSADEPAAMSVSPDGTRLYVTGRSVGSIAYSDYATVAYDASTGARIWTARYNGPGNNEDSASAMAVSPDGTTVYVTGGSWGGSGSIDYTTLAYDASTGANIWISRYSASRNYGPDAATALVVSPDGSRVYVTGYSYSDSTNQDDYATVAYDSFTGGTVWVKRLNGKGDFPVDQPTALAISPDGTTVFVTGYSYPFATVAYAASTGTKIWTTSYRAGKSFGVPYAMEVSPDGTMVYVAGSIVGETTFDDFATIAYAASTGTRIWSERYDGPGNSFDDAYALALSPDGANVYVTGQGGSSIEPNYVTVAYDASTGARGWIERYDGPGNDADSASAVAVNPDGTKVYVTGGSLGSTSGFDFATIAYAV